MKHLLFIGLLGLVGAAHSVAAQCALRPNVPINATDCGAAPNKSADQTVAIQNAINASCNSTTSASSTPLYVPAGEYHIVNLFIRCSGLLFYGAGSGGRRGGLGGTQLCSSGSTAPIVTVGTPTAPVARVTLQDLQLSGFCGAAFPPGGITMACLYCHLQRVSITGFDDFGIEFTGA